MQDASEGLCAGLLRRVSETNVKGTTAADPAADPGAELIYMLNNFHIPSFGQFLNAQSTMPAFRDMTEALGIQCQDIEWFSRAAMLKITLQNFNSTQSKTRDALSLEKSLTGVLRTVKEAEEHIRSASSSSSTGSMFSASSFCDAPFWFMPEPDELCRDADRLSCTATAAGTFNTTISKSA
ncbi:MAG: hypothetical protein FRX49_06185 [Trebouxia sp. A1-2]|nr:MAG: hypothetical protein FRX49_06185 [Trebouxia sp. A1-2]